MNEKKNHQLVMLRVLLFHKTFVLATFPKKYSFRKRNPLVPFYYSVNKIYQLLPLSIFVNTFSSYWPHRMCQDTTRFIVLPSSIQTSEKLFGTPKGEKTSDQCCQLLNCLVWWNELLWWRLFSNLLYQIYLFIWA